jgi:hypothetical protein
VTRLLGAIWTESLLVSEDDSESERLRFRTGVDLADDRRPLRDAEDIRRFLPLLFVAAVFIGALSASSTSSSNSSSSVQEHIQGTSLF